MQDILSSLATGLHKAATERTSRTLGDRTQYIGMSDIGKAAACLRAAVAGKLVPYLDRPGNISLQRGHWFESGIAEAFRLSGESVLYQLAVHARHNSTPIIAHLDFVRIVTGEVPRIQVIEVKSAEHMPDTAHAAHEMQLFGQMGLLQKLWNQNCFCMQDGSSSTFPDLARHTCGIVLPKQPEHVAIEGVILMLSMSAMKLFGPYRPNAIMLDACFALAEDIWNNTAMVRNGEKNLNDLPVAQGFHPLCDWCDYNVDCPRFAGTAALELESELLELERLKEAKDAACTRVQEAESTLKTLFRRISPQGDWVSAHTRRFRSALCEGRKTLDRERLATALTTCMAEDEAEALITAGYKTGEPYERLYVGNINGGQAQYQG